MESPKAPINDSGQPDAVLPPELRGFSWAGFWGSWVWAVGNKTWLGVWGLVPCIGFMVRFTLGDQGNEWAWRNKKWESIENFRKVQKIWAFTGFGLSLFSFFFWPWLILYPVYERAVENSTHISCHSNLKQIGLGTMQYIQDHDGKCPPGKTMTSWKLALYPYLKTNEIFICPQVLDREESYVLNPKMPGANLDKMKNPDLMPIFFDTNARHVGFETEILYRNVAFADGHVKGYKDSVWKSKVLPRISVFFPDKSPNK